MKINLSSVHGNVLITALIVLSITGLALGSYLNLVRSQNLSTMRSQQWNSAIPVAEAGVEEALTQLYYNPTNLSAAGWTSSNGLFLKERVMGSNKYVVTISTTSPPVITASGYVQIPMSAEYIDPPRKIQVTVTNDAMFAKGMVAKGAIDLNGNNIETDSFDSSDPSYSTGGLYDDAKAKDSGDVATNSGLTNSFNVGNAKIYGKASTGPGGALSLGPNGAVGPKSWHGQSKKGVAPGYFADDMNVSFPDVKVPFSGGGLTPSSGTVSGTSYNYVLGTGNYQMSSLSMSGGQKMKVTGDAVLYVTDDFSMTGNAQIEIAEGASLKLYVAGSANIAGNGIINETGNAQNFSYYGLPTNTDIAFSGNATFVGTVYAPSAEFTLGGGGSNDYDFVGASVTASVKMNGNFNFHYDEALGKFGPRRQYTVTSWNEI